MQVRFVYIQWVIVPYQWPSKCGQWCLSIVFEEIPQQVCGAGVIIHFLGLEYKLAKFEKKISVSNKKSTPFSVFFGSLMSLLSFLYILGSCARSPLSLILSDLLC